MAAVTTLASSTSFPIEANATLANGTWQEFTLPTGQPGWRKVSVKVTGDAVFSWSQALSDGDSVSGTYPPIVAADGWLTFHGPQAKRQQATSLFVAGDGATPTCYVTCEGQ